MYRNNDLDDYNMIPFQAPNYIYMPKTVDPVVEQSCFNDMLRGEEDENRQNNNVSGQNAAYDDYSDRARPRQRNVDRICNMIQKNNPGIMRTMMRYGIPYPVAVRLCRRIVRATLRYCR